MRTYTEMAALLRARLSPEELSELDQMLDNDANDDLLIAIETEVAMTAKHIGSMQEYTANDNIKLIDMRS